MADAPDGRQLGDGEIARFGGGSRIAERGLDARGVRRPSRLGLELGASDGDGDDGGGGGVDVVGGAGEGDANGVPLPQAFVSCLRTPSSARPTSACPSCWALATSLSPVSLHYIPPRLGCGQEADVVDLGPIVLWFEARSDRRLAAL